MSERHLVRCGGARLSVREKAWRDANPTQLTLSGPDRHVTLKVPHITRALGQQLPPAASDLLELATYVYAADQVVRRGGDHSFDYGTRWRRHFRFIIPVRRPDIWSETNVSECLRNTLGFLTDDDYEFDFVSMKHAPPFETYLTDSVTDTPDDFEEVMLFSGGLDSFGGAVQEILQGQRKVVLVSHRPVSKIFNRQRELVRELTARVGDPKKRPLHIPVEVNLRGKQAKEFTQRCRSFLYASLAAVIARAFHRGRIRFYENGIVSFNFPLSQQVVGSLATRTTHPQVLSGFEQLFSLVFKCPFQVENPFLWKTKADVLREIKAAKVGKLCSQTGSCTHTMEQTVMHSHCGMCSQCVDRRLSALAAGFENDEDPSEMYASDIVTGPREDQDWTMIERYVGTVREIHQLQNPNEFLTRFPEASRVAFHLRVPAAQAVTQVFHLYQHHADDLTKLFERLIRDNSRVIASKIHPPNCLLSILSGPATATNLPSTVIAKSRCPRGQFAVDRDQFCARYNGKECSLRNTKEFALLVRLNASRGRYLSIRTLAEDVWQNDNVEKNTIQRTISNLRRKLKEAFVGLIKIDGTNRDHYSLLIASVDENKAG